MLGGVQGGGKGEDGIIVVQLREFGEESRGLLADVFAPGAVGEGGEGGGCGVRESLCRGVEASKEGGAAIDVSLLSADMHVD